MLLFHFAAVHYYYAFSLQSKKKRLAHRFFLEAMLCLLYLVGYPGKLLDSILT